MYVAFVLIVFLGAMVVQTTVFNRLGFGEIKPDLILVIVVYLGLVRGSDIGCTAGFFFGLIRDVFSAVNLGTNALSKTIVGFFSGLTGKRLYTQSLFSHILCVGTGTVVDVLLGLSINGFIPHWERKLLLEILYNILCCPVVVWIFRYGEQRLGVERPSQKF